MEIIQETKNPLFDRVEVIAKMQGTAIPSYLKIGELLSKKFKIEVDAIKIKKVSGKFGTQTFDIVANIYPTKEDKDKTETKTKQEVEAEKKALEEVQKAETEAKVAKKAQEEAKVVETEKPSKKDSSESEKPDEGKEASE